jgi:hypothetical protein
VQFEALMRTQAIDAETASLLHLAVQAFVGVLALVLWEEWDAVAVHWSAVSPHSQRR